MPLFTREDGLRRELSALEVDGMTPLEALTKLYELVERAREEGGGRRLEAGDRSATSPAAGN